MENLETQQNPDSLSLSHHGNLVWRCLGLTVSQEHSIPRDTPSSHRSIPNLCSRNLSELDAMAILDAQGRLFGKLNILDLGAGLVILMVLGGIFLLPGKSGTSLAQIGASRQSVEVDVLVRGLNATAPKTFIKEGNKVNVIVRKQPSGEATLKAVKFLPKSVAVPQPDGSLKALPDPRQEIAMSNDMILTLTSNAQIAKGTPVLGGEKVKVGTQLELDGETFNFASSVINVRLPEKN